MGVEVGPAAAVDKNAGDRRSVAAGRRGGNERLPTSLRMSSSCSRGSWRAHVAWAAPSMAEACCRRRRAAKEALTAAL